MKRLSLMLFAATLLFSCSKVDKINSVKPDLPKYDVTFTVSDFTQSVGTLNVKGTKQTMGVGDTLKNYADNLYYRIYNSAGVQINSVDQTSTLATFGTITDKLPAGTYNVFIAAAKGELTPSSPSLNYTASFYQPTAKYWNDTYSKQFQLTVGTTAVTQALKLGRTVGGIQLTLQDAIPSNAAKITIVYQTDALALYENGTGSYAQGSTTRDFPLTSADIGQKNKTFLMYVGNTSTTSSVNIRAYDASNTLIVDKIVTGVRCYSNQKTSLTGSLFPSSGSSSVGFTVTVNPIWDTPTSPVVPFNL